MHTPTVTPITHAGPSPHAPEVRVNRPVVKRRWTLAIVDGHAYPMPAPTVLKPDTFITLD